MQGAIALSNPVFIDFKDQCAQGLLSEDEYCQVSHGRIKQLVADTGKTST